MGDEAYVPVPEFYAGKSVFITGGGGYLGKVLLEKLLYSCPKVDKVYVLLRDKKNVKAEQRLRTIKDLPLFNRLRNERPQDLDKIVLTKGDINVHNLNMKTEDLDTVIEKVSVVIHSAATIKFKESLKTALETNVEGTRNVLNLCRLMKNIPVFVHLSTAYSNVDKPVIEEKVYPPPVPIEDVYKFVENEPDEAKTARYIGLHPNTYTFTKALAEHLISDTHGNIPAVIVRPSIVSPSKDEPVNGWVDNWFGATAFITTITKGICRVVYTSEDHILDLIPVDYVCNFTLIAAARAKRQKQVAVYNSCSGSTNPLTMNQARHLCSQAAIKEKFNDFPCPNLMVFTKRYWIVRLINMLILFAACIADLLTRLTMKRPKYTKLATQTVMVGNLLQFFTSNSWLMKTDKSKTLYESLSACDARLFPCLARDINWKEYIHTYLLGIKTHLMEKKKE